MVTATLSAAEIVKKAKHAELLHEMAEEADTAVELALWPAITTWHQHERVPCGHTGGWSYKAVSGDRIELEHDCFDAHHYDRHEMHSTTVDLSKLLELLPAEATS